MLFSTRTGAEIVAMLAAIAAAPIFSPFTELAGTSWFSPWRGSDNWLGSGKSESNTRAVDALDSNNIVNGMNTIVQTPNVARETISVRELIPFWFAISSPLLGVLLGLMGAWFVTWLSA